MHLQKKFYSPLYTLNCVFQAHNEPLFDIYGNYSCHESQDEFSSWLDNARFWLSGVAVLIVGTIGLAGNLMTVLVLRRIDSNVMFNKLLISLGKNRQHTRGM